MLKGTENSLKERSRSLKSGGGGGGYWWLEMEELMLSSAIFEAKL